MKAEKEGMPVENVGGIPPKTATEHQIEYASSLGIKNPGEYTLDHLSYLISIKTGEIDLNVPPPSPYLLDLARKNDAIFLYYETISHDLAVWRIIEALDWNSRECKYELTKWYICSVIGDIKGAAWEDPSQNGYQEETLQKIIEQMINNDKAFASLEREIEHRPFEIFRFDSSGDHHSRRTKAYQYAETLIQQNIGIGRPKQKRKTKTKEDDPQKTYSLERIAIAKQILNEIEKEINLAKPEIHYATQLVKTQDDLEKMTKCEQCGRLSPRDFKNCYYCKSNLSPIPQDGFFSKILAKFR
ncbi:hypothetical protein KAI46_08785 [bacterium]|nr:hypothetical protein [bacterium]